MPEHPDKTDGAAGQPSSAPDQAALQQEGLPYCPDQLRALLAETLETNRLLREAEDRRKAETYNALTAGLYGMIQGWKSIREDTKLIRRLREKRRQKALAKEEKGKRP